jgi:hypothetical protein
VLLLVLLTSRPAAAESGPRLYVSAALEEVAIFGVQTITISSLANNSTPIQPSPGPILILVSGSNGVIPNLGCSRCALINGGYVLAIQINESFSFGTVNVLVHDFSTNLTSAVSFTTVLSADYIDHVIQRGLAGLNTSAQAKYDALIGLWTWIIGSVGIVGALTWVVAILAAQHRLARAKNLMSWVDRIRLRLRVQRGQSSLDLILRETDTWAQYVPKEVRLNRLKFEESLITSTLRNNVALLEELSKNRTEQVDLKRTIRETRTIVGLDPVAFLDQWTPGAPPEE